MFRFEAWKTSGEKYKFEECAQLIKSSSIGTVINIVPERKYQEIIGFGGALNELGFETLSYAEKEKRDEILENLFGESSCDFTFCRLPIGANDFALDEYSLNDVANDFEMKNFSIERDEKCIIPYVKEALKVNPKIEFCSCPWSPPSWMKTTGDMCNGGELIDSVENLKAYAKYLVKYLVEYIKAGVPVTGICIQNETDVINIYPTSTMPAQLMKKFLRAYFIPEMVREFKKNGEIEIFAGTIRDVPGYAEEVLEDEVIKQFVKGVGFQYSSKEVVSATYNKNRKLKLIHTEAPCHNGANSWEEAKEIFKDMLTYLENGCENYCYWNLILDETCYSSWNWQQNSLITINKKTKEVKYNPEYYVMKHFSSVVKPGATRIESFGNYEGDFISFLNKDGSIACIINNFTDSNKEIVINIGGKSIEIIIEADSIYSFRINL